MEREIPDSCKRGDHDFGQAGRCSDCNVDRANLRPEERRTGGAGSLTQPLTDREYREEMRKLERVAGE